MASRGSAYDELARTLRDLVAGVVEADAPAILRFRVTDRTPLTLLSEDGDLALEEDDPDFEVSLALKKSKPQVGDYVAVLRSGDGDYLALGVMRGGGPGDGDEDEEDGGGGGSASISISIGTVTTLAAGAPATATLVETGEGEWELSLGIPAGPAGAPAPSGSGYPAVDAVATDTIGGTYDNGAAGLGATLKGVNVGAFPLVDGETIGLGDRVLLPMQDGTLPGGGGGGGVSLLFAPSDAAFNALLTLKLKNQLSLGPASVQSNATLSLTVPTGLFETLTDTFTTTTKWTLVNGPSIVSNQLSVPTPGVAYAYAQSAIPYKLTGSFFFVELVYPSTGTTVEAGMTLALNGLPGPQAGSNHLGLFVKPDGAIVFRIRLNGANDDTTTTYDPVAHRFIRISETGGNIVWSTSPTGEVGTWTTQRTAAAPFAVTSLRAQLFSGYYGTETARPAALFDNANTAVPGGGGGGPILRNYSSDLGLPGLWADQQEIGGGSDISIQTPSPIPGRSAHSAYRFTCNGGERAELADYTAGRTFGEGDEYWFGDIFYAASGQPQWVSGHHTIMQFKNAGTGSPPLNMDIRYWGAGNSGNGIQMQAEEPGGTQYRVIVPMSTMYDRAIRIEMRVKFSTNPSIGNYEVWADGVQKIASTNMQTLYSNGADTYDYLKEGQYGETTAGAMVVYWEGFYVGASRASVMR